MNDRRLDDPTAQLMAEMYRYDLDPKTIIWDGRKHRFPGAGKQRGTNAWYFAYPDRRGAHFGDFSSGVKVHWRFHRDTPFSDREKKLFAKQKAERERELAKKREIALENVRKVWAAAEHPDPEKPHPYLFDKGIKEPPSPLRISTLTSIVNVSTKTKTEEKIPAGLLLVPMYRRSKLVNLQRIYPNGDKLFFPGADPVAARHSIGVTQDTEWDLCYVCEGLATGYAINRLTNRPVIVAFTAGNLLAVATAIRNRFDPGEMRLAADNDRWTKISQGEKGDDLWNVGVQYAREAAAATRSKLVIPDFKDLEGKPTDFHDLLQREGENAARHWLDPENTAQATWQLPVDDPTAAPAEEPKEKKQATWEDEAPFRPLGHNDGTYYVASEKTGQVRALSEASLGRALAYISLADGSFWRKWFKGKGPSGFSIPVAGEALVDACMAQGVFREGRYRGRGIWRTDKGDAVFHWGDRLLAPGATDPSPPERFKDGDRIYPQLERLAGPAMKNPMTLDECLEIHGLFETLAFESEGDAALLAGFIVNAPLSGWLDLRPHVWLNGPSQSGKSTLVNHIIAAMLKCAGVIHREAHLTTEPAIRQMLKGDALPLILDEADMGRQKSASNLRGLFELCRSASTGGTVSKGSTTGNSQDFTMRSMFLFCSIVVGLKLDQDKNRVAVLTLKHPRAMDPEKRRKHWAWFQRQMIGRINPQQGRRLLARTVEWVRDGRYEELLKVTTKACYTMMRTARAGDLYGTLVAGSYLMRSDEIPSEGEVVAWLKDAGIGIDRLEEKAVRVARGFLELLLQARIPVMQNGVIQRVAVGELIDVVAGRQGDIGVKKDAAHEGLRRRGLWVEGLRDDAELLVANQSEWIKKRTERTPFEGGWYRILRALPGAAPGGEKRFYPGMRSRVTKIPLSSLSE